MYRIKNSKHLASVINYTNLSNMISEAEMTEFLNQAKELNFNTATINPTYVNSYADEFNSNIYGEGNYLNTCSRDADAFNTIAMKLSDIIVKNWKQNMRNAA